MPCTNMQGIFCLFPKKLQHRLKFPNLHSTLTKDFRNKRENQMVKKLQFNVSVPKLNQ